MYVTFEITRPMLRNLLAIREAAVGYPREKLQPRVLRRLEANGLVEPGARYDGAETIKLTNAGFLALKLAYEIGERVQRVETEPPR